MIQELIERLNDYCAENDIACMDNLSRGFLNELEPYKLDYVKTVDTDEYRWYVLAENVYRLCVDGKTYYLGTWEVETLKSEAMSVSDCGHVMKFYEMEEYTTVSYRRKMTELKPCPFCGKQLIRDVDGNFEHPNNDCILSWLDSDYGAIFFADNEENIAAWNRRAYDDAGRSD